jgi:hypothetical protein
MDHPRKNKKPSFQKEAKRREAAIQREIDRYHRIARMGAMRNSLQRKYPRPPPRPHFAPLLPQHAATSNFSFVSLQSLPLAFPKRLAAIPLRLNKSLLGYERPSQQIRRKILEKKWCRPGPTFYEQLVIDLEKDHQKEMWLRFWFRATLMAWRYRRYAARASPMDPITLDPIRVPVRILDYNAKRMFVFEASALNKLVRQALLFQQYSIAEPQTPRNPYTNLPFSYGQLIGLHRQLAQSGCVSQEFHMWRAVEFCLERFKLHMEGWLTLHAKREELYNLDSADGIEMLGDFIVGCLEDLGRLPNITLERLVWDAVQMFPEHPFLCKLRSLCLREIEGDLFELPIRRRILFEFLSFFETRTDLWDQVRMKRRDLNRGNGAAAANT